MSFLNAVATAAPSNDIHRAFLQWADIQLEGRRDRALFQRMASRSGIAHRFSVLGDALSDPAGEAGFYSPGQVPRTSERMAVYAEAAPTLALQAIAGLGEGGVEGVTHLVVASCTGFVAPGIDQILARALGLDPAVERTLIGFMGCYAAVNALRTAWHIVRSRPDAKVLVVTVELCSLHLQATHNLESLLAMMLFADGAAAAIVSGEPTGLEITEPFSRALPDSGELITWTIGDAGFEMGLSGEVPSRIIAALGDPAAREALGFDGHVDAWAVHAGGRSILDAVEQALRLGPEALGDSRAILHEFGNMSSSTLMFVLARMIGREIADGRAMAFGPGLAVEGFRFRSAG